jgi:hypothetical protein
MVIREKHGAIRIAFGAYARKNVEYLAIEPKQCWCSTFDSWGKRADNSIVEIGGKKFRVTVEEVL